MRLLIAVVQAYDTDRLLHALTERGFGATRISSIGGFLRMANATVLSVVDDERLPEAKAIVAEVCARRVEITADSVLIELEDLFPGGIHEVPIGGGVIFSARVEHLVKITPDEITWHTQTPART